MNAGSHLEGEMRNGPHQGEKSDGSHREEEMRNGPHREGAVSNDYLQRGVRNISRHQGEAVRQECQAVQGTWQRNCWKHQVFHNGPFTTFGYIHLSNCNIFYLMSSLSSASSSSCPISLKF